VRLRANVGLDEEVSSALFHGAEGIGLFRTEFLFMERETAPTEEEHYRAAKAVLRRMAPYPVTMRTFDLGGDKCSRFLTVAPETNPAMGLRSLRLAFREREIFSAQLRGLMRAALHGPLRIMLPLVSGLGELRMALDMVRDARLQLVDAGLAHAEHVEVGIMIEMPSAAVVADLLVEHVDFVSIGTNDLIQYTLGIDRENESVEYLYRPLHPAILRLIAGVAAAARAKGVPVSLCGEMAADPRYVWILVGLGVEELSMHPSAIPVIKSVIRGSSHREMVELAHRVCACGDGDEAEALVLSVMGPRFSEHLQHGASVAPPPQPEDSLK
jgi:phosphotransferase system enzyme I (PtsI)